MLKRSTPALAAMLLLAGCDAGEKSVATDMADGDNAVAVDMAVKSEAQNIMAPLTPPAPGTPGGLPVAPAVLEEGAIDPSGPQGAGQVVQKYYALLESKHFPDAQMLWSPNSPNGKQSPSEFLNHFEKFSEIHANIGAPGNVEGAAGSLYISVPAQIYARVAGSGKPYYALRSVTLRRSNNVPGSTEEDRQWHITEIGPFTAPATAK